MVNFAFKDEADNFINVFSEKYFFFIEPLFKNTIIPGPIYTDSTKIDAHYTDPFNALLQVFDDFKMTNSIIKNSSEPHDYLTDLNTQFTISIKEEPKVNIPIPPPLPMDLFKSLVPSAKPQTNTVIANNKETENNKIINIPIPPPLPVDLFKNSVASNKEVLSAPIINSITPISPPVKQPMKSNLVAIDEDFNDYSNKKIETSNLNSNKPAAVSEIKSQEIEFKAPQVVLRNPKSNTPKETAGSKLKKNFIKNINFDKFASLKLKTKELTGFMGFPDKIKIIDKKAPYISMPMDFRNIQHIGISENKFQVVSHLY